MQLDDAYVRELIEGHDLGLSDALLILEQVFPTASSSGTSRRIEYTKGGPPQLTVEIAADGSVKEVLVGGLDTDTAATLVDAFNGPRPKQVMTSVMFSTVPTRGWWRYRHRFQILPMPDSAPGTDEVYGPHPFLLEVAYEGAERMPYLDSYRASVATREVGRLLSGILRGPEDRFGQYPAGDWFVTGEPGSWRSLFGLRGYYFENLPPTQDGPTLPKHDAFTLPSSAMPRLAEVDAGGYYDRVGISSTVVLQVPDSFGSLVDAYFALDEQDGPKVLLWCHWLNHAQQVIHLSASAAHIAAVQAVEAIISASETGPACESCGRPTGIGPSRRFRDFLEEYAPGASHATQRKEFYGLRSALTHGGRLVSGELRGHAFFDFAPYVWLERETMLATQSLARLAGTNWLLSRSGR
jgi:hypothetical protein